MKNVIPVLFLVFWSSNGFSDGLTLEKIMANPDWIGNAPENAYVSSDGQSVYYTQKRTDSALVDHFHMHLTDNVARKLDGEALVTAEQQERVYSSDRQRVAWTYGGDVFWKNCGHVRRLTKTGKAGRLLGFIENDAVALLQDTDIVRIGLSDGVHETLAAFVADEKPHSDVPQDYLSLQQRRLFDILQRQDERREEAVAQKEVEQRAKRLAPQPIYLGKEKKLETVSVSPNGQYVLFGVSENKREGKADKMPHYVSSDGYVSVQDVRSKVGTDKPDNETVFLLDLRNGQSHTLRFDHLPGIKDDPLLALKKAQAKKQNKKFEQSSQNRALYIHHWPTGGVHWNDSGSQVAINLFSYDNKDRWLVRVDFQKNVLQLLHHLHDKAWVNDNEFNEFGWLGDSDFWFTSEESGYSHLYLKKDGAKPKALTSGLFEVNRVQATPDKQWLYYRANKAHPGNHEVFRVSVVSGLDEAVTQLGGGNEFTLSPKGDGVVVTHSTSTRPPELFWLANNKGPRQITHTVSEAFRSYPWISPEIVAVPSRHGKKPVYARVYRSQTSSSAEKRPAVMFVHGAGYLQNAHMGWSVYFREYMFHNLLVEQGYVVIDMDYRASEGYGRHWRTAIYQQMGTPELQDYLDGVEWLVKEANVDRDRIGIYGGSYGGFMAFMALFKTPEVFAAGAALRPVTDWAHYNHGYTSNILNTPDVDPDAYARSSPIEFAQGLTRPLLICVGMLDDNVFFQDSVRLVQRLIELKKERFEMAVYPIEPHGFKEPESWLDEYRRIYKLMEREVKQRSK